MNSQVLRSRAGKFIASLGLAFSSVGTISLFGEPMAVLFLEVWPFAWLGFFTWLLFWNPCIKVSESGLVIENIFRTNNLNWSAIKRIDTKYSLEVETNYGTIRAWSAPAPSRYAGFLAKRTDGQYLPESSYIGNGMIRPGDLTSSDSGYAAYIIRSHWENLRDSNKLDAEPHVETRWATLRLFVFLFLSGASAFSFMV